MEAVSQTGHALQCASLAEREGAGSALVAAALLHYIGHVFRVSRVHLCRQPASTEIGVLLACIPNRTVDVFLLNFFCEPVLTRIRKFDDHDPWYSLLYAGRESEAETMHGVSSLIALLSDAVSAPEGRRNAGALTSFAPPPPPPPPPEFGGAD